MLPSRTMDLTPSSFGCSSAINRTFPPAPVTPNHRRWRLSKESGEDTEHLRSLLVLFAASLA
jgi:hypothetical protein